MTKYRGRVAVITGASSGIGLITAKSLAASGWRIIAVGRNASRCVEADAAIRSAAVPGIAIDMIRADLSLLSEADRAGREIARLTNRVDVLLNNAGGLSSGLRLTAEGNEATFVANHLAHFLLTASLMPLLYHADAVSEPGEVRIINVSSSAHEYTMGIGWDDVQSLCDFTPMKAYMNAKLANVLYTKALARHLATTGIVVHAMHPGAVDSNFYAHAEESVQAYARESGLVSAEDGADTLTWLATDPSAGKLSGHYYYCRKARSASAFAEDIDNQRRLWIESELLVKISGFPSMM